MTLRTSTIAASALTLLLASPGALALNVEYGGGLRAEYSTNMPRTEDAESDLLTEAWGGVTINEQAARWNGQIAAVAAYESYLEGTLEDDLELALAALADVTILPQRLSWHIEDYYQQVREDYFRPSGPGNEQNSNVLWTGPDLQFRLAQLYTLELGARYGDYYYGETVGDNQRLAVIGRFERRLSEISELYLVAEQMEVDYEYNGLVRVPLPTVPRTAASFVLSDFDRQDLFAGYHYESPLTELRLDVGVSEIDRDIEPDLDGPLVGLSLVRNLSPDSELGLRFTRRYSESGEALLSTGGFRLDPDVGAGVAIEDITQEDRATIFYDSGVEGLGFSARVFGIDEEFQTVGSLDRWMVGAAAERSWRLSRLWGITAGGAYRFIEYRELNIEDEDLQLLAEAVHRLNSRLSISIGTAYNVRTSTIDDREFDEWVGMISLRYGVRPSWSIAD